MDQNRHAEAEPLVVGGYEGMKSRKSTIPATRLSDLAAAATRVVSLYDAWGRPAKAAEWRKKLGLADLPANVFIP